MQSDIHTPNPQAQTHVKVFLRINCSKKGTDFPCPSSLTESALASIIHQVIDSHHFIRDQCTQFINHAAFVSEGHQIDAKSQRIVSLRPNSIIHMIKVQDTDKKTINVTFRYQNPQENQDISHFMQISTNDSIESEVQKICQLVFGKFVHELTFVHLGADISSLLTFKEAKIEENAELILIDKLKNEKEEADAFWSGEQLPLQGFTFEPRKIQVEKKDSIEKQGLNMPFNPIIEANRVKLFLEQNVRENELFIQQQQLNALEQQNIQNQLTGIEAPQLIQIEEQQANNDSEKEIPTKEEIEAQNPAQKMDEQPPSQ